MARQIKTQQELYNLIKVGITNKNPSLTDFETGSNLDALLGGISLLGQEFQALIISEFRKLFFSTAEGSATAGLRDELEFLAIDRFGSDFSRPEALQATVQLSFTSGDAVIIESGTIVKTEPDAQGVSISFETLENISLTANQTKSVSARALVAGAESNVAAGLLTVIETPLTVSNVTVTNPMAAAGGIDELSDAEYRDFIERKLKTLSGATIAALESAARNTPGVDQARVVEILQRVIEYNDATSSTVGTSFNVIKPTMYIANSAGGGDDALIKAVENALEPVRACGVNILVEIADTIELDWSVNLTLAEGEENFDALTLDSSPIVDFMENYIRELGVGQGFDISIAEQAVENHFGAVISGFRTVVPAANISIGALQKLIPGDVSV